MTTLHLGVLDVPYATGGKSTGDVADILEAKYHVMEIFFEEHQAQIAGAFEETIGDQLENLLSGAPPNSNSLAAATGQVETMFHKFISMQEMDGIQPGVPTKAALKGVNHRLARPTAKGNPQRPSFRDTGLYDASFKAWID
jgi:hypothetical protein